MRLEFSSGRNYIWNKRSVILNLDLIQFFTIYTSSLLDVLQNDLPSVYYYAGDTQLYVSFSPADETGHLDAIAATECCVKAIRCWMRKNKLLLNEGKTEFLLIGTKE